MIHKDVEAEDVHNHRTEQCKAEWNVTSNQENQSAENLAGGDDVKIVRGIHRRYEISRRAGHGRHGNEMQKGVRTEDGEHKSEQDAGNDGGDFHAVLLNEIDDISITKVGGSSLRTATIY